MAPKSQHVELSQSPYSGYPCLTCRRPHIYSELWQHYHEHFLMALDPVRLGDLILELNKSNWLECSRRIKLPAPRTGYTLAEGYPQVSRQRRATQSIPWLGVGDQIVNHFVPYP